MSRSAPTRWAARRRLPWESWRPWVLIVVTAMIAAFVAWATIDQMIVSPWQAGTVGLLTMLGLVGGLVAARLLAPRFFLGDRADNDEGAVTGVARRDLAAWLAADLGEPLAELRALSERLASEDIGPASRTACLQRLQEVTGRIDVIVADLAAIEGLTPADHHHVEPEPSDTVFEAAFSASQTEDEPDPAPAPEDDPPTS